MAVEYCPPNTSLRPVVVPLERGRDRERDRQRKREQEREREKEREEEIESQRERKRNKYGQVGRRTTLYTILYNFTSRSELIIYGKRTERNRTEKMYNNQ